MSGTPTPHVDLETLLRLVDDDLPDAELRLVDTHLGECNACRGELDGVRDSLGEYRHFHIVMKAALPPPPKPWTRLEARTGAGRFHFALRPWLVAAATIAAVLLLVWRFERAPGVKAAELLRKAAAAEKTAPPRARVIRIRSRRYKWDRPAQLPAVAQTDSADASGIRRLLESAGYGWEDPLSVQSFARWHDQLAEKQDRVESLAQALVIHTTTTRSAISDASLTLGADLHAIACTLRFGAAETLEMREIPAEESAKPAQAAQSAVPVPVVPVEPVAPPASSERPATAGDALHVIAALHRIGADLGEPIDIRREGPNILVNVTGLDPRRQAQVKAALSGLPDVRLRFGEFEHGEGKEWLRRSPPQVDSVNPLLDELQAAAPGGASTAELADRLTDNIETVIVRVYALRGLARRFPSDTAKLLTAAETATLNGMLRDHAGAAAASTSALKRVLAPVLPQATPAVATGDTWQDVARGLLDDARSLDQALQGSGARKDRAADALAAVEQRLARLQSLSRP